MHTARLGRSAPQTIFICNLRRAAEIPQNRSIIQKMRREKRGGGGYLAHRVAGKRCKLRVNCAPSPWDVAQAAAFFTSSVLLGIQCGRNQDTTRCVSAMGATTMPIIEPPPRWKVQTVRLPAIVSRSTFRLTTGHRQLGIR